ncbi:MAG: hypothetical protein K2M31_06530 [Muribaculaceae bacterium]|nr:hypothetical protein [Muribaculaceae bacterium]
MILVGMVVGSIILINYTLINRWWLCVLSGIAGVLSGVALGSRFRYLTGIGNRVANSVACGLVTFVIIVFGVLAINYFPTDFSGSDGSENRGIIEKRYQQTRYQSRRTGRRTYSRGAPYQVYFLRVALPEWGERNFEVPKKCYESVRQGDTVTIALRRGALLLPVVNPSTLRPLHPHSHSTRRRCRFFGTTSKD